MHHQPLLVVLRADQPLELRPRLQALAALGLRHIEIAWQDHPQWVVQCLELQQAFPQLRLGAASICSVAALRMVAKAGLGFAMSPVLSPELWQESCRLGLALVPGVYTPSEVHQARSLGCPAVKLFPASSLGPSYWRQLRAPLGDLPFCIAAGGLGPEHVPLWLEAGVDAVALGGRLEDPGALESLRVLVSRLSGSGAAAATAAAATAASVPPSVPPPSHQRLH
ncbi:2-dehydro-3-deoxyphosphogluconate aldolase [Cyanobium sp. PCC 7001]|uniref:bifunctional 4-hydroxy-2-oxoglutarate aldolase/2-dehydro-3-deoxy-phosphogluconate aldolase n=1 Tax=Cyanobium sp. PCC 7001 TaxID=180281 RepID=UPI0001805D3F|nr:bifunctional 4-hydroxy-2-oxoglutarate aldolase/2-dehydro-3-deoxy-phosphogluconate aldolase [Cyanobium sp. PCC 7001]EDY38374.1 2-dehydro-3-deoxyphosphogluconate aldolase [Cyanobium sp. PCC 7001]